MNGLKSWVPQWTQEQCNQRGWMVLQLTLALIIGVHGWYRMFHWSLGMGEWLTSIGIPFGNAIQYAITALEALGGIALLFNRGALWVCIALVPFYVGGVLLAHLPRGWFVVGPGRDGAEWGVLLLGVIAALIIHHWPNQSTGR